MTRKLSEQEKVRRESLQKLRELGIDPYPAEIFDVNTTSKQIKDSYKDGDELDVIIAGRLMNRRIMGKASFAELQDAEGRIQLYVNRDEICEGEDKTMYNTVFKKLLDIGDIVGIKGVVFTTKAGEITVIPLCIAKLIEPRHNKSFSPQLFLPLCGDEIVFAPRTPRFLGVVRLLIRHCI